MAGTGSPTKGEEKRTLPENGEGMPVLGLGKRKLLLADSYGGEKKMVLTTFWPRGTRGRGRESYRQRGGKRNETNATLLSAQPEKGKKGKMRVLLGSTNKGGKVLCNQ